MFQWFVFFFWSQGTTPVFLQCHEEMVQFPALIHPDSSPCLSLLPQIESFGFDRREKCPGGLWLVRATHTLSHHLLLCSYCCLTGRPLGTGNKADSDLTSCLTIFANWTVLPPAVSLTIHPLFPFSDMLFLSQTLQKQLLLVYIVDIHNIHHLWYTTNGWFSEFSMIVYSDSIWSLLTVRLYCY